MKKYKRLKNLFGILSFLCTILPFAFVVVGTLIDGVKVEQKLVLTFSVVASFILVLINTIKKNNLRSPFYLVLLGISYCFNNIGGVLVLVVIFTLADEMVFAPLHAHFKEKYRIIKTIREDDGT